MRLLRSRNLWFALMFCLFLAVLLYLDWIKGSKFRVVDHAFWVRVKTYTLIAGSLLLAFTFCGWRRGLLFAILYVGLWGIYALLNLTGKVQLIGMGDGAAQWFGTVVLLFTPFPVAIFFLIGSLWGNRPADT